MPELTPTLMVAPVVGFAVFTIGLMILAMYLGYLGGGLLGIGILWFEILMGAACFMGGAWLGYDLAGRTGAWIGLLTGILLATIPIALFFKFATRGERSGRFAAEIWLGLCALCLGGYWAGGWLGLLTITLPAIGLFWLGLYRLSAYILPLRDQSQRGQTFRALLTFNMGTNYPYYFVDKNSQLDKRVNGNPFLQRFAGPGILYLNCEHAAYLSDGIFRNREFPPGLNFTSMFDLEPRVIDLRPQVRAFPVEALTRDGIPIKVVTFIPFKIATDNQTVEMGKPFPFRSGAIHTVIRSELAERKADKNDKDSGKKHAWDGGPKEEGLIPVKVAPIIKDIINRYNVDELCAPRDPARDPRVEIATELRKRVDEILPPMGLERVGGGISNLVPQNDLVVKRRLDSWRTEWEREILRLISQGSAQATSRIHRARAEAEVNVARTLSEALRDSTRTGNMPDAALALRFFETLGEIVSESNQWPLPSEIEAIWQRLRGETEEKQNQVPNS